MRPANLPTAAADVLAGAAISRLGNLGALPWVLLATICLYAGGVTLNDAFDAELDAKERPERPIPRGAVSVRSAFTLGGILLLVGVGAALVASPLSGLLALAIAGCAVGYDGWSKRLTLIGAGNMGACRGLNLLLGMSIAGGLGVRYWPLAIIPAAYVAAITVVSRGEVQGASRASAATALVLLLATLAALLVLPLAAGASWWLAPFLLFFAWRVLPSWWRAWRRPEPESARAAVRAGVLSLVPMDAALAAAFMGAPYGLVVLALLPLVSALARVFAVT